MDLAQLMVEGFNHIATRFDGFDKKIDQLDLRLGILEKRMGFIETGLIQSEKTLSKIEQRLTVLEIQLGKFGKQYTLDSDNVKSRISCIEDRLDDLEEQCR